MTPKAPRLYEAPVVSKTSLSPTIVHVRLGLLAASPLMFRAGQFLQWIIAPRVLRQYSICSPPGNDPFLDFCVDISPAGAGSQFVMNLREGDLVTFRGPFGVFVVPLEERRPIEFVATGAGIAPIRSMIHDLLKQRAEVVTRLLFGNRSVNHLVFDREFRELAAREHRFSYVPTLTRPPEEWSGERGRVTEVIMRTSEEELQGKTFYVCGSPAMVDDTRRTLQGRGVAEGDIHFEKFI